MTFKGIYRKEGGHYTLSVFVAPAPNQTFAKTGDLTMDERDFRAFKRSVRLQSAPENENAPNCWTFEEA